MKYYGAITDAHFDVVVFCKPYDVGQLYWLIERWVNGKWVMSFFILTSAKSFHNIERDSLGCGWGINDPYRFHRHDGPAYFYSSKTEYYVDGIFLSKDEFDARLIKENTK